jgi:hypothetical protein
MESTTRHQANPAKPVRKAKRGRAVRPGREEGLGAEDEPVLREPKDSQVLRAPTVRLVPMA